MLRTGRIGAKHFTVSKQVALIEGHGCLCVVWPVLQCPCLLEDRQFDPVCPACHGTGRYYPPNLAYSTMLLLHQETSKRTMPAAGSWTEGSIAASLLPGVQLAERDKVQVLDMHDTFNDETLTRGLDDTVRFQAGVVLRLVADRERVYRAGLDYTLQLPATIAWMTGGQSPDFGQQYAVSYSAMPEYLVVNDTPRLRVEHRITQASEVILLRLDKLSEEF